MDFNYQIKEITTGGIPGYNRVINEIIRSLNWILKIKTTNGKPMSGGSGGPTIDLAQVDAATQQPWLIDPNGAVAGWTLITYLDASNNLNDMYVWSGVAFNTRTC